MTPRFFRLLPVLALVALGAMGSSPVQAEAPVCFNNAGDSFCRYLGRVRMLYVNAEGRIIVYFDTPMAANAPSDAGIAGVTIFDSAIFTIADNPDSAKMMYSALLSAQTRRVFVTVQLKDVLNGRLKISRIWTYE
jgi:hypothetical protein